MANANDSLAGSQTPSSFSNTSESSTSAISSSPPISKPKSDKASSKSVNIFSNDGSFLERFQKNRMDEQEKQKIKDEIDRKITFEDRFKNRGKRKLPPLEGGINDGAGNTSTPNNTHSDPSALNNPLKKKHRTGKPLNEYEQELKKYQATKDGLSDSGTGVRPLIK